jgi:predicted RecB family nuclease
MQNLDGVVVFSATDVNNFLECEHVTQLELAIAEGRLTVAPLSDAHATLLAQKGDAHEQAYLHALREAGTEIVEIDCGPRHDDLSDAVQRTVAAMRAGAPVIYQPAFLDGQWRGHADFLERVDRPSMLGAWSYEVADTKLARHTKPYFLLQLCFYSEQVARLQGVAPERMHVVLGTRLRESFRYSDFSAYFRRVRTRFLSACHAASTRTPTRWSTVRFVSSSPVVRHDGQQTIT